MYNLGYLQNFDKNAIPTVNKNLIPALQHPSFDPERQFSAPWQSGMTGLVVNTAAGAGRDQHQRPLRGPRRTRARSRC